MVTDTAAPEGTGTEETGVVIGAGAGAEIGMTEDVIETLLPDNSCR